MLLAVSDRNVRYFLYRLSLLGGGFAMADKQLKAGNQAQSRPVIDTEECKGCGRCVAACPQKVLRMRPRINHRGVQPAEYAGEGCVGCGICFYNCPEPYGIEVETPAPEDGKKKP